MLAATRSGVMPVRRLRANASGTRFSLCNDVVGEPRVGARVERERREVLAIVVQDLAEAIAHVALHGLAFAQHLGVPRRRASSRPFARRRRGGGRCRRAPGGPGSRPGRCRNSPRLCADASGPHRARGRTDAVHARRFASATPGRNRRCSSRSARRDLRPAPGRRTWSARRTRSRSASTSRASRDCRRRRSGPHRAPVRRARSRAAVAFGSVSMSNDSTRGSILTSAGPSVGLSNTQVTALPALGFAIDRAARLDAAFDEISDGKAHVGLVGVDSRRMQPVAHWRHVPRRLDLDARDLRAVKGSPGRRRSRGCTGGAGALQVCGADIEMGSLSVVPHQERRAVLQAPVDLYDRPASRVCVCRYAVAGLRYEATEHQTVALSDRISQARRG